MSLEKFQATDAWRNKFKSHLFAERKPAVKTTASAPITHTPQRLSYQLSEELQTILEEKKIPCTPTKMPRVRVLNSDEDDKENITEFHKRIHAAATTPSKLKRQPAIDMTLMEDGDMNDPLHITNTSFETLENMCEKTASDPNSTLFQYLRNESQTTKSSLPGSKARVPTSFDEEADALQRLLDELNVKETEKEKRMSTLADETQLEDIEAPSRLWENTITPETLQSISPVKMVGLMRQSTIMEELSDASECETSTTSYVSAMKTGFSSETTGCYETANNSATGSERGMGILKQMSTNSTERPSSSSSSELFQQRHSRQKFFDEELKDSLEDETDKESEQAEKSMHLMNFSLQNEENDPLGESLQLIDLDGTVKGPPEDEEEDEDEPTKEPSTHITKSNNLFIELSDDESDSHTPKNPENVLNRSFTVEKDEPPMIDEEKSLHFNDTMEEVEYMMNKGMQYIQQAAKESQLKPSLQALEPTKNHLTPVKKFDRYRSPSPMLSSPASQINSPRTVIAKPKPMTNKHALDIKPFPKLDLFKKPQGSNLRPVNKLTSSLKKQQYAHVVSPIGAYIKKTPTTPLMSTVRPDLAGVAPSTTSSTSKALRKLDCDSLASSPKKMQAQNSVRSLPKKAYISSELKHIVDERTKVTIPGGPKIQRYLASAMIPAVVRHEGKVKMPANLRTGDMGTPTGPPRRTDDSLADLSLVSGDVSVYTIKDAQKF